MTEWDFKVDLKRKVGKLYNMLQIKEWEILKACLPDHD